MDTLQLRNAALSDKRNSTRKYLARQFKRDIGEEICSVEPSRTVWSTENHLQENRQNFRVRGWWLELEHQKGCAKDFFEVCSSSFLDEFVSIVLTNVFVRILEEDGRLAPAYFSPNYKDFHQLLQTVRNRTTVLKLVFKEF